MLHRTIRVKWYLCSAAKWRPPSSPRRQPGRKIAALTLFAQPAFIFEEHPEMARCVSLPTLCKRQVQAVQHSLNEF
jgi:hypothetical protein